MSANLCQTRRIIQRNDSSAPLDCQLRLTHGVAVCHKLLTVWLSRYLLDAMSPPIDSQSPDVLMNRATWCTSVDAKLRTCVSVCLFVCLFARTLLGRRWEDSREWSGLAEGARRTRAHFCLIYSRHYSHKLFSKRTRRGEKKREGGRERQKGEGGEKARMYYVFIKSHI